MNWVEKFQEGIANHGHEKLKAHAPHMALAPKDTNMKHHKFHKTTVEHHKDGSHTVHHHHEDGEKHDVKGAVADHDGMMDHIMDHTSAPNPGEMAAAAPAAPAAAAVVPPAGA